MKCPHLLLSVPLLVFLGPQAPVITPEYTPVYTLSTKEGVFAYARISPDGNALVYASEQRDPRRPNTAFFNETVVDLVTREVVFTDPGGIDAYWSVDGSRIIYAGQTGVTIRHMDGSGAVAEDVAPRDLGDYYSWAVRDGKDLILTIDSKYFFLDGAKGVMPAREVSTCPGIGTGERPLISKDGMRITTFVQGNVVVRGLDNCDDIFDTGIQGAKADFSYDGRYIAFHAVKPDTSGYEIKIVDLEERTVRTLSGLEGSGIFPSWTRDGRLCFRYDGPDFRGFMMASNVLDAEAVPLPSVSGALPTHRGWSDIFPETPSVDQGLQLVLIWAPWSVHSQEAFRWLGKARDYFLERGESVEITTAADPGSEESDITRQMSAFDPSMTRIPLSADGLKMTEGRNQMPTTLLFRNGVLVGQRLGAQSFELLRDWVVAELAASSTQ